MSQSFIAELERQIEAANRALLRAHAGGDAEAAADARDRLADLTDLAVRSLPAGALSPVVGVPAARGCATAAS